MVPPLGFVMVPFEDVEQPIIGGPRGPGFGGVLRKEPEEDFGVRRCDLCPESFELVCAFRFD